MGPKLYLSAFLIAGAKHTSDTADSAIAFMNGRPIRLECTRFKLIRIDKNVWSLRACLALKVLHGRIPCYLLMLIAVWQLARMLDHET